MKPLNKKILKISLFLIIFLTLTLIATFLDYQISDFLASSSFHDGNYFSDNVFGRIFEVIGEMPLYLFLMVAGSILFVNTNKIINKPLNITLKIFSYFISLLASLLGLYKLGKYLAELHPDSLAFLHDNLLTYGIMGLIALLLVSLLIFISNKYLKDVYSKLMPLAIVILFTAICSQIIVQGIKPFVGRERFRAIYYLNYRNVESQGFTKWFIFNGYADSIASSFPEVLNVSDTFFSSFPSGHTAGAGITYAILALPLCYETLSNKKTKVILYSISIFITGLVGLARIVMGAHYLSDVLFGGTIAYLMAMLGILLYKKFANKILNYLHNKNLIN